MTKGQKKKTYTDEFKQQVVKELMAGAKPSELAKKHSIASTSMIYGWKEKFGSKAMKQGKKEIKADLKKQKGVSAPTKAVVTYLKHALTEMEKKHVRGRYRALVELAYFTLIGE